MDANDHAAWVEIAKQSSHKAFAEKYMTAQVENLDKKFEDAYKAAGVKLVYMDANDHAAWVEIAKQSSHKAFAEKVPGGDKLMEMALAVK